MNTLACPYGSGSQASPEAPADLRPAGVDPSRKDVNCAGDWTEDLDLSPYVQSLINKDHRLLSLLYDLDLLPEQLMSQDIKTPGLVKAYHRLYGVLYAYQAFANPEPPAQGIEAEGQDPQGLGAKQESPVAESDAP